MNGIQEKVKNSLLADAYSATYGYRSYNILLDINRVLLSGKARLSLAKKLRRPISRRIGNIALFTYNEMYGNE